MTEERVPPKRPRGRTPLITRDQIIQAVFAVGFDRLTLTAVADHLGVGHAALYNHIRNRDDLVESAIREAFRAIAITPADSWRSYLEAIVWNIWDILERYPGLATLMMSHGTVHPIVVRFNEIAMTLVEIYGFAPEEAVFALDVLHDFTDEPLLMEIPYNELVETKEGTATRRAVGMAPWVARLDPRLQPAMTRVTAGNPRDWLGVKLRATLDGVEMGRVHVKTWDERS